MKQDGGGNEIVVPYPPNDLPPGFPYDFMLVQSGDGLAYYLLGGLGQVLVYSKLYVCIHIGKRGSERTHGLPEHI